MIRSILLRSIRSKNSIEINGQLEPVVVNKDNTSLMKQKIFFNDPIRFYRMYIRIVDHENELISLIEYNQQKKTQQSK